MLNRLYDYCCHHVLLFSSSSSSSSTTNTSNGDLEKKEDGQIISKEAELAKAENLLQERILLQLNKMTILMFMLIMIDLL